MFQSLPTGTHGFFSHGHDFVCPISQIAASLKKKIHIYTTFFIF